MPLQPAADEPPPIPPTPPGIDACCRRGCDPCIFDLYEEELARYEVALRKWQERHQDNERS